MLFFLHFSILYGVTLLKVIGFLLLDPFIHDLMDGTNVFHFYFGRYIYT
jgi:hypothetical protein